MIEAHTSNAPLDDAGKLLTTILKSHSEENVLMLFSGGSSLAIIDRLHPKHISSKHTLTMLDERFTHEKNKGNYAKLENTPFFKQALKNGAHIIDPRPEENETLEDTAKRFDLDLKHWHIKHHEGIVIATVGIGADGHTAGVLPMPEDAEMFDKLFLKENLCVVGYTSTPEKTPHPERITTTLTYIERHIDHAIIYAGGVQKRDALRSTLGREAPLHELPAYVLNRVPDAQLFSDLSL